MASSATVSKVKTSLRISASAYDTEIGDLIDAARRDIGIAGVEVLGESNPLILRAITTYCKMNFGAPGDYGDYNMLKASFDEQKSQLRTASDYNGRSWDV